MIQFSEVSKRYPNGRDALRALSFHIDSGELVFLTGHSGAGKSTVLRLIAGIETPTRGQVIVRQQNVGRLARRRLAHYRRGIGVIFQDHKLLQDRTVFDNVALPLFAAGASRTEIGKRVRAALDRVGLLGKERLPPLALSGGEQQRVGIARAVVARPPILLADEPTGNLDPQLSLEIMQLFDDFHRVGVCVLIATHDLALLQHFPARVLTLVDGCLATAGR